MDNLVYIIDLIYSSYMLFLAAILCLLPFKERLKYPIKKIILVCLSASIIYTVITISINRIIDSDFVFDGMIFVFLILAFFFARKVTSISSAKLVFILTIVCMYVVFVNALGMMFSQTIWQFGIKRSIITFILSLLTALPMYHFMRGVIAESINNLDIKEWNYIWVIPATYFILALLIMLASMEEQQYLFFGILTVTLEFSAFASITVLFRMLRQTEIAAKAEKQREALEIQLNFQREQYQRMGNDIEASRQARHNIRQQYIVLKQLIDQKDLVALSEYTSGYIDATPEIFDKQYTKNFAINSLMRHYASVAESEGISIDTHLNIPADLSSSMNNDISIVVGNMLENAIEACRKITDNDKRIHIGANLKNGYLVIWTDNTYKVATTKVEGNYLSTKRLEQGKASAGIGLPSIAAICNKYGGSMSVETEHGIWKITAMFRLCDPTAHDENE